MSGEPIAHIAHLSDWRAAQPTGRYEISTRGTTLAQAGFIHCAQPEQLTGVAARFYADDPEPLVVLVIDPDRLKVPVREEPADPKDPNSERFPHVYGPIPVGAVIAVHTARISDGVLRLANAPDA